ncbi:MAG: sugar ABC transporter substrate-binding protein [Nocardioides sp.]
MNPFRTRLTPASRARNLGITAVLSASALVFAACGGGGFEEETDQKAADEKVTLDVLIASSGDAETDAVKAATEAWADESGNKVNVTVASDMAQELSQGFAGGNPPDLFYLDASRWANFAKDGSLYPYAEDIEGSDDYYQPLKDTFTYEEEFYCVPKDFSTLALQINTDAWKKAGLTDADIPTDWDQLADVAAKLTTKKQVGLALSPGIDRLGLFAVQNGGWWLSEDGSEATAASPETTEALGFVQERFKEGSFAWAAQVDAGWGGEAFGAGKAAMTIEGNWIKGAMSNDYPDVKYISVELPAGPAGKGTLLFTQCWGVAADSDAQAQAVSLIESLTSVDNQLAAAEAFGVMPSRISAAEQYNAAYPDDAAFIAGGEYGQGPITAPGMEQQVADLNSKLENFADADLTAVLEEFDTNAGSVLGK